MGNMYGELKPALIMIVVQTILAVVNISYKCAVNDGMRLPVLVAYRSIFGAAFMLPLAFFIERGKRPKLTWKIVFYGFLCGLFVFSLWLILQTKAVEQYPCPYTFAAMMNVWSSLQSVVYAVSTEKHWGNWIMGWDIRLFTTAITGILGCGVMFTLVAWCLRMRGPLFVAIFNPLVLVMVAVAGSLLLEEKLYVGTLLGAILIVGGLYAVLWGKGQELKKSLLQFKPQHEHKHKHQNENENENENEIVCVNISKS